MKMFIYSNKRAFVWLLSMTAVCGLVADDVKIDDPVVHEQHLDLMVDFGYPVSVMQSVRHDLAQAVYAAQQNVVDQASVLSLLENALSKLSCRTSIQPDDRQFIEKMIADLNALIEKLEASDDQAALLQACEHIHDKL